LTDDVPYPYLIAARMVWHCQFLLVHWADRFERLAGCTIDDARASFDKFAR